MHLSLAITPPISGQSSLSNKPLVINPQSTSLSFQSQQVSSAQLSCIPVVLVVRPSVIGIILSSAGLCVRLRFPTPLEALSVCLQAKVCSSSMAGSQQKALAMAGVCTLLVLTFLASDVNAAGCSIAQLNQCTAAVTKGATPTPACCGQVALISDFNCFCNILLGQRNVPLDIINNAVHVPMKCGNQGAKLRNKQCGKYTIP